MFSIFACNWTFIHYHFEAIFIVVAFEHLLLNYEPGWTGEMAFLNSGVYMVIRPPFLFQRHHHYTAFVFLPFYLSLSPSLSSLSLSHTCTHIFAHHIFTNLDYWGDFTLWYKGINNGHWFFRDFAPFYLYYLLFYLFIYLLLLLFIFSLSLYSRLPFLMHSVTPHYSPDSILYPLMLWVSVSQRLF